MIRVFVALMGTGLLLGSSAKAMNAEGMVDAGIKEFDRAYRAWDGAGFGRSAAYFEKAAKADPKLAAAQYWLGVSHFHRMLNYQHPRHGAVNEKSAVSERHAAEEAFDRLLEIDGGHAEGNALKATILGMKIDGSALRGMRHGPALQRHQKAAMKSEPENPRVRFLTGVGLFHVAKKSKDFEEALAELEVASRHFAEEAKQKQARHEPRWGRDSCHTFLGLCLEKLGRNQEAVSEFRRALVLHPPDKMAMAGIKRLGGTP